MHMPTNPACLNSTFGMCGLAQMLCLVLALSPRAVTQNCPPEESLGQREIHIQCFLSLKDHGLALSIVQYLGAVASYVLSGFVLFTVVLVGILDQQSTNALSKPPSFLG